METDRSLEQQQEEAGGLLALLTPEIRRTALWLFLASLVLALTLTRACARQLLRHARWAAERRPDQASVSVLRESVMRAHKM